MLRRRGATCSEGNSARRRDSCAAMACARRRTPNEFRPSAVSPLTSNHPAPRSSSPAPLEDVNHATIRITAGHSVAGVDGRGRKVSPGAPPATGTH